MISTMSEILPYTSEEIYRDQIEENLAVEANKKDLLERNSNGIHVIAYWMVKENVCTIWVEDARVKRSCEFTVPNDEVTHWFEHPCSHKDYQMPTYQQRLNHE